ncbi:5382_t:CDS:10 [Funneliformis caledonium]|uniref:mitogen-activated protein kinase kinase kinase n=1 Tax=Funneliformis caledonium TaxID=1117310 RepID=A0A9N8W8Q2_9GLOM|nr:5382_t:CDS:10 [Funneliformis caledonium]
MPWFLIVSMLIHSALAQETDINVISKDNCPPPLIVRDVEKDDSQVCFDDCCVACPFVNNFYEVNKIDYTFKGFAIVGIISFFLMILLSIFFYALPSQKQNPLSRQMLLPLAISVMYFEGSEFFTLLQQKSQCVNHITPANQNNNILCAIQAFFTLGGGYAISCWSALLMIHLHLMSVWRIEFIAKKIVYFHGIIIGITSLAIIIPFASKKVQSNNICFISPDSSTAYFYFLSFIYVAFIAHVSTFVYMAHITIDSNRRYSPERDLSIRASFIEAQRKVTYVKAIFMMQWRALLGASLMLAIYVINWNYYIIQLEPNTDPMLINSWLPGWIRCLITYKDQNICAKMVENDVVPYSYTFMLLFFNRTAGILIFVIFAAKKAILVEAYDHIIRKSSSRSMELTTSYIETDSNRFSSLRISVKERTRSVLSAGSRSSIISFGEKSRFSITNWKSANSNVIDASTVTSQDRQSVIRNSETPSIPRTGRASVTFSQPLPLKRNSSKVLSRDDSGTLSHSRSNSSVSSRRVSRHISSRSLSMEEYPHLTKVITIPKVALTHNSKSAPPSPGVERESRITFEIVRQWKLEQVSYWLQENNFREYQKIFAENDINGEVLLELDHDILKELKIRSVGDRIRMLLAVKSLLKICRGNIIYPYTPTKFLCRCKELSTPETDKFPTTLARSDSLPRITRSNSSHRINSPKSPSSNKLSQETTIMSIESVKQRCIKVIGEDGQSSRTIPINDVSDAKSILARVLQKFNIKDDVERYSLFTTLSDSGSARCLTDEEVENICKSADRQERERLFLRKKHLPMNHETFKKHMRDKKLANFFGEKPPSIPQGITQKKLRNFFGQRPPSELISLNLTEYFPGHDSEELERSVRFSMRRASRSSMSSKYSSRPRSKRISRLFENNPRQSSLLSPLNDDPDDATIFEEVGDEFEDFDSFEDNHDELNSLEEAVTKSIFKWIQGTLIGMGSFGSVYLALNSITGELMAVKQVELPTGQSANEERKKSMLDALQREISLLQELQHENIVQYLGTEHKKKTLNIFLEYVPGGSVATMLNNYGPLEEPLIRSFNRQILQGLNYLHEKDIIHRDIKGANILVDNKGGVKISDFGISKKVEDQIMATSLSRPSLQGSVFWMAPEVVKQTSYTSKADIWSLGCLIVEMFTGTHPYPQFTQMQAIFKIGVESISPEIPENISNEAEDFLKKTFEPNHDDRPTAKALLTHPFSASTSKSNVQLSP